MVRNLYRGYLYAVCIALLIAATTTTSISLGLLLMSTPLRGPYDSPPGRSQLVQASVAFVTVWIVTLLLGGLHYWLIRRDMREDPAAGGGTVRSLFLNITQLVAAPIAVASAAVGISSLGQSYGASIGSFSAAIAVGGLFALVQWERSRAPVRTDPARAFQRLHLYGAQLALVFVATPFWLQAVQSSALNAFARMGLFDPCVYYGYTYVNVACMPTTYYSLRQSAAQWGGALLVAACWAGYTAYSRSDRHSRLRQVTHLLAFGYALGFVLWGAQRIFATVILTAVGHPLATRDFPTDAAATLGALIFGAVTLSAYYWLYAREASGLPSGVPAAGMAQMALAGIIFAYPFWLGAQSLLSDVVERAVPAGAQPDKFAFAQAGALLLSGLPFVYFALRLNMRARQTDVTWPHRVFALILLASGVIASAAGLVIALQALISALLGAPADNWQQSARTGMVTLLVGGAMVAIFATVAARNRYLAARPEAKPLPAALRPGDTHPVVAAPEAPGALEAILDALLAGRLSRDEAATQIRAQTGAH